VRLAQGDAAGALEVLGSVAATVQSGAASVLLSPRRAVAEYAEALLAADQAAQALTAARLAMQLPGEDVRGRVFADRVLARAEVAAGSLAIGPAPVA
jgi:hypothetical protein